MQFIDSIDAILLGRVTYELFAGYWPSVESGDDKPFADKINAIPKIVFSKTLDRAPWGRWDPARIVRTDAAAEIRALKDLPGKDVVVWGSLSLAQSLLEDQLVDECQLVVCPIVLGQGTRLFPDQTGDHELTLLHTQSFDRGTVLLAYAPARLTPSAAPRASRPA